MRGSRALHRAAGADGTALQGTKLQRAVVCDWRRQPKRRGLDGHGRRLQQRPAARLSVAGCVPSVHMRWQSAEPIRTATHLLACCLPAAGAACRWAGQHVCACVRLLQRRPGGACGLQADHQAHRQRGNHGAGQRRRGREAGRHARRQRGLAPSQEGSTRRGHLRHAARAGSAACMRVSGTADISSVLHAQHSAIQQAGSLLHSPGPLCWRCCRLWPGPVRPRRRKATRCRRTPRRGCPRGRRAPGCPHRRCNTSWRPASCLRRQGPLRRRGGGEAVSGRTVVRSKAAARYMRRTIGGTDSGLRRPRQQGEPPTRVCSPSSATPGPGAPCPGASVLR